MTMSAVFPSMVSLYTKYRKIVSYLVQISGAFITFNLSETLEGRLLGERRLLEEIRYLVTGSCTLHDNEGHRICKVITLIVVEDSEA